MLKRLFRFRERPAVVLACLFDFLERPVLVLERLFSLPKRPGILRECLVGLPKRPWTSSKPWRCYTFLEMAPKISIDSDRLRDLCHRWKVTELSLFGSVLRDDFRQDSDVDVLVAFAPDAPWSIWDLSRMRDELEAILGRRIDLLEKKGLRNPFLRQAVLTSRQVLYAA